MAPKTKEETAAEIAALKEVQPKVRRTTFFGDDNHAAIDAQIEVLESADPWETANNFDDDHLAMHARDAAAWIDGDYDGDSDSLAAEWAEVV